MLRLEEIKRDDWLLGLVPNEAAKVVSVDLSGDALLIVYRPESGGVREETIFRDKEAELSRRDRAPAYTWTAPGREFRLGLEALRMKTAHLYDPMMALHTSDVEPLPHQITAVYEAMLPKQPLRFVLADFFAGGCLPLRPHSVAAYPLTREAP